MSRSPRTWSTTRSSDARCLGRDVALVLVLDRVDTGRQRPLHDRRGDDLLAGGAGQLRRQVERRAALPARAEPRDDRHRATASAGTGVATTWVTGRLGYSARARSTTSKRCHTDVFERQRRDHDLIRVEGVDGVGQRPQRPVVTQRAVGVQVLRAQRRQGVVQPCLGGLLGRLHHVERAVRRGDTGLDRAGRHDDEVAGGAGRRRCGATRRAARRSWRSRWPSPAPGAASPWRRRPSAHRAAGDEPLVGEVEHDHDRPGQQAQDQL